MMKSKHFGRILRNRREELGWSLQKVSELCNMSTKGYEKIELGDSNPRLLTALKVIRVLGLSASILDDCMLDIE